MTGSLWDCGNNFWPLIRLLQIPDDYSANKHLDRKFFQTTMSVAKTNSFTRDREVTTKQMLPVGNYVIVPSTFAPGEEADYLLRIFSFKNHQAKYECTAYLNSHALKT